MSYFSTIEFPEGQLGAFGDFQVMNLNALLHWSFATGLRDQLIVTSSINAATVDTNLARLRVQSGTSSSGSAIVQSAKPASYRPGQGITARFTPIWSTFAPNSMQYFGMGTNENGYFFGYSGSNFGIIHRNNSVDNFISQSTWNGDVCNGSGSSGFNWDKTKGVPMMVKYPYLGYGNIDFWVQNPSNSKWIPCHTIKYANSSATTQLSNPSLSIYGQVLNAGNTSNLTMFLGSAGVFLDGIREFLGPQYGADSTRATVTTEVPILNIKCSTVINGVNNRGLARLRAVTFVSDGGNGVSVCRMKKGSALTGAVYYPVDGTTGDQGTSLTGSNSIMSFDTGSTALSGGKTLFNTAVSRNSSTTVDMTPFNIFVAPGEVLTFSMNAGASATCVVAVNWQEDVQ